jgi:SAM-dependent methyltransferase
MSLLDVGCGPGTITADFATHLYDGQVIGIDAAQAVIAEAAAQVQNHPNLSFATGDIYNLDFADDTFDVVHAHQVLQHLTDPVAALREMRRVIKPKGFVAVRECDFASFSWAPRDERLDQWMTIYHQVTKHNRAEADAGRYLLGWAQSARLHDIRITGSLWTFADEATRAWWGELWAERIVHSSFGEQAIEYGFATKGQLEEIAGAWQAWRRDETGFFGVPNVEIIAGK